VRWDQGGTNEAAAEGKRPEQAWGHPAAKPREIGESTAEETRPIAKGKGREEDDEGRTGELAEKELEEKKGLTRFKRKLPRKETLGLRDSMSI